MCGWLDVHFFYACAQRVVPCVSGPDIQAEISTKGMSLDAWMLRCP